MHHHIGVGEPDILHFWSKRNTLPAGFGGGASSWAAWDPKEQEVARSRVAKSRVYELLFIHVFPPVATAVSITKLHNSTSD